MAREPSFNWNDPPPRFVIVLNVATQLAAARSRTTGSTGAELTISFPLTKQVADQCVADAWTLMEAVMAHDPDAKADGGV